MDRNVEYIRQLEDRNRQRRALNEKSESQQRMEERERGFTTHFRGAHIPPSNPTINNNPTDVPSGANVVHSGATASGTGTSGIEKHRPILKTQQRGNADWLHRLAPRSHGVDAPQGQWASGWNGVRLPAGGGASSRSTSRTKDHRSASPEADTQRTYAIPERLPQGSGSRFDMASQFYGGEESSPPSQVTHASNRDLLQPNKKRLEAQSDGYYNDDYIEADNPFLEPVNEGYDSRSGSRGSVRSMDRNTPFQQDVYSEVMSNLPKEIEHQGRSDNTNATHFSSRLDGDIRQIQTDKVSHSQFDRVSNTSYPASPAKDSRSGTSVPISNSSDPLSHQLAERLALMNDEQKRALLAFLGTEDPTEAEHVVKQLVPAVKRSVSAAGNEGNIPSSEAIVRPQSRSTYAEALERQRSRGSTRMESSTTGVQVAEELVTTSRPLSSHATYWKTSAPRQRSQREDSNKKDDNSSMLSSKFVEDVPQTNIMKHQVEPKSAPELAPTSFAPATTWGIDHRGSSLNNTTRRGNVRTNGNDKKLWQRLFGEEGDSGVTLSFRLRIHSTHGDTSNAALLGCRLRCHRSEESTASAAIATAMAASFGNLTTTNTVNKGESEGEQEVIDLLHSFRCKVVSGVTPLPMSSEAVRSLPSLIGVGPRPIAGWRAVLGGGAGGGSSGNWLDLEFEGRIAWESLARSRGEPCPRDEATQEKAIKDLLSRLEFLLWNAPASSNGGSAGSGWEAANASPSRDVDFYLFDTCIWSGRLSPLSNLGRLSRASATWAPISRGELAPSVAFTPLRLYADRQDNSSSSKPSSSNTSKVTKSRPVPKSNNSSPVHTSSQSETEGSKPIIPAKREEDRPAWLDAPKKASPSTVKGATDSTNEVTSTEKKSPTNFASRLRDERIRSHRAMQNANTSLDQAKEPHERRKRDRNIENSSSGFRDEVGRSIEAVKQSERFNWLGVAPIEPVSEDIDEIKSAPLSKETEAITRVPEQSGASVSSISRQRRVSRIGDVNARLSSALNDLAAVMNALPTGPLSMRQPVLEQTRQVKLDNHAIEAVEQSPIITPSKMPISTSPSPAKIDSKLSSWLHESEGQGPAVGDVRRRLSFSAALEPSTDIPASLQRTNITNQLDTKVDVTTMKTSRWDVFSHATLTVGGAILAPLQVDVANRQLTSTKSGSRILRIGIRSNHGDPHYVGLCGIELFSPTGQCLPYISSSRQSDASPAIIDIQALPEGIHLIPGSSEDPRQVCNLLDGHNPTRDELHQWITPRQDILASLLQASTGEDSNFDKAHHERVLASLQRSQRLLDTSELAQIELVVQGEVAAIRLWNWNGPRTHVQRAVADIEVSWDGMNAAAIRLPVGTATLLRRAPKLPSSTILQPWRITNGDLDDDLQPASSVLEVAAHAMAFAEPHPERSADWFKAVLSSQFEASPEIKRCIATEREKLVDVVDDAMAPPVVLLLSDKSSVLNCLPSDIIAPAVSFAIAARKEARQAAEAAEDWLEASLASLADRPPTADKYHEQAPPVATPSTVDLTENGSAAELLAEFDAIDNAYENRPPSRSLATNLKPNYPVATHASSRSDTYINKVNPPGGLRAVRACAIRLEVESTWGDTSYTGLCGLQILGADGCPLNISASQATLDEETSHFLRSTCTTAVSSSDRRPGDIQALDTLLNSPPHLFAHQSSTRLVFPRRGASSFAGANNLPPASRMIACWPWPREESLPWLSLQLVPTPRGGQEKDTGVLVTGLRVWNYASNPTTGASSSPEEVSQRGVRTVRLRIDGQVILRLHFRPAPVVHGVPFAQTLLWEDIFHPAALSCSTAIPTIQNALKRATKGSNVGGISQREVQSESQNSNGANSLRYIAPRIKQHSEVVHPPTASVWRLALETNHGDPWFIGLDGLEFFDPSGHPLLPVTSTPLAHPGLHFSHSDSIPSARCTCNFRPDGMAECSDLLACPNLPFPLAPITIAAVPSSLRVLDVGAGSAAESYARDERTVDRLFAGGNDGNCWLAPLASCMTDDERLSAAKLVQPYTTAQDLVTPKENSLFILFPIPVTIAAIRFRNYSKTPSRGVREVAIWADGLLVARAILLPSDQEIQHLQANASLGRFGQTLLFSADPRLVASHRDSLILHLASASKAAAAAAHPDQGDEQDVLCIDERRVMVRSRGMYDTVPVSGMDALATRPTTSLR